MSIRWHLVVCRHMRSCSGAVLLLICSLVFTVSMGCMAAWASVRAKVPAVTWRACAEM